jgi:hypothetical protein
LEGTKGINSDIVRFITCDTHHVDNWLDLWITFFDIFFVTDITSRIRRVVLTFGGIYDTLTGIQLNNRVKQCDPNHKNTFPTRPKNRLICQSPLIDFQYKD